jgi:hypothetical protein
MGPPANKFNSTPEGLTHLPIPELHDFRERLTLRVYVAGRDEQAAVFNYLAATL